MDCNDLLVEWNRLTDLEECETNERTLDTVYKILYAKGSKHLDLGIQFPLFTKLVSVALCLSLITASMEKAFP